MNNTPIFKATALTKSFKKFNALDGINLTLETGHIYGLVGNNGAGKTTLMRIIMGLSSPTSGSMELFGSSSKREFTQGRKKIGVIIESPIYYSNMSGRKNLELIRILYGTPDRGRVDQVLQQMDLSEMSSVRVSKYSLGMRQRLALAGAMLSNPEFLILDEPLNGLDPSGIRELREILIDFNRDDNHSILISSHYLEQLHMLATDYIILHKGKIIEQFTQEQLSERCKGYLLVESDSAQNAEDLLMKSFTDIVCEKVSNKILHVFNYQEPIQRIYGIMAKGKLNVERVEFIGQTLEEYFNTVIGGIENGKNNSH